MHAAEPVERRARRERPAPGHRRLGPLSRPPQVGGGDARRQGQTVDPPGEQGTQLAREHGAHRLVHQREPRCALAAREQHRALGLQPHRGEVGAATPARDRGHVPRPRRREVEVAALVREKCVGECDVGVLDALRLRRDVALRAGQPAGGDRRPAGQVVLVEHHPGTGARSPIGACRRIGRVGPPARGERLLHAAQPPGRVGQRIEFVGTQHRARRVVPGLGEAAQQRVRLRPRLARHGVPGALQGSHRLDHGGLHARESGPSLPVNGFECQSTCIPLTDASGRRRSCRRS